MANVAKTLNTKGNFNAPPREAAGRTHFDQRVSDFLYT